MSGPMFTYDSRPHPPVPHRCPVCEGSGMVPPHFYDPAPTPHFTSTAIPQRETCRGCNGRGLVWAAASPPEQPR